MLHWVSLHCSLVLLSFFFLSSCVFALGLHVVFGRNVAVRGGKLKKKEKAGGGLGGGHSASPPDALGVLAPGDQGA